MCIPVACVLGKSANSLQIIVKSLEMFVGG
jgi:hypothetical protein